MVATNKIDKLKCDLLRCNAVHPNAIFRRSYSRKAASMIRKRKQPGRHGVKKWQRGAGKRTKSKQDIACRKILLPARRIAEIQLNPLYAGKIFIHPGNISLDEFDSGASVREIPNPWQAAFYRLVPLSFNNIMCRDIKCAELLSVRIMPDVFFMRRPGNQ